MRARWYLAGIVVAAAAPARADEQSAESYLDTARQLAARGQCDEALRLRPIIERLDPELARARFTSDPAIAACLAGTAPPPAPAVDDDHGAPQPSEPPHPVAPTQAAACDHLRGYMEPSLFAAAGSPGFALLARDALGVRLADCNKDGGDGAIIELGGTFSIRTGRLGFGPPSGAGGGSIYAAGGGEVTASYPVHGLRLGVRAGIEGYYGSMTTVGVRVRKGDTVYALDGFLSRSTVYQSFPQTSDGGVMVGIGYGPDVGVRGFLGGLGLAALVALVGLSAGGGN